nr:MAG TPA: hypothetical protein [Caudoviricetes sp.]
MARQMTSSMILLRMSCGAVATRRLTDPAGD